MNTNVIGIILAVLIIVLVGVFFWSFWDGRNEEAPAPVTDNQFDVQPDRDNTFQEAQIEERDMTQEEQEERVEEYIHANISDLSPEEEVLGGTFYVTDIRFTNANSGVVEYEDGHIALIADFTYTFDTEGNPEVQMMNVREQ